MYGRAPRVRRDGPQVPCMIRFQLQGGMGWTRGSWLRLQPPDADGSRRAMSVHYLLPEFSSSSDVISVSSSSHKTQPLAILNICKFVSRNKKNCSSRTTKQIFAGQFQRPPAFDGTEPKETIQTSNRPGGPLDYQPHGLVHTLVCGSGDSSEPTSGAVAASPAVSRSPQPAPRLYNLPPSSRHRFETSQSS
jgi:hypothetical protein